MTMVSKYQFDLSHKYRNERICRRKAQWHIEAYRSVKNACKKPLLKHQLEATRNIVFLIEALLGENQH